jgi:hypothetical protein
VNVMLVTPTVVCMQHVQGADEPTSQELLSQLPGLLAFLKAATEPGRGGGPPGCALVAAAAGHDGDAAVLAIAHVMRARRLSCYEALLLASRRRAALQLKVRHLRDLLQESEAIIRRFAMPLSEPDQACRSGGVMPQESHPVS